MLFLGLYFHGDKPVETEAVEVSKKKIYQSFSLETQQPLEIFVARPLCDSQFSIFRLFERV